MDNKENKEIAKVEKSASERFTSGVMKEFQSISGDVVEFSPNQKRLSQHMFVKVDASLKDLEAKRQASNNNTMAPYTWANVNIQKMAIDAVHRIEIGLDALIDNHISMIPYFNRKLQKYDLDLRIGYSGKDFYKRRMAYDVPKDIIYELVYSNDTFEVVKKDLKSKEEGYHFKIEDPFNRGEIVGGFGYIVFDDESKNKLVIVTEADFEKSKGEAKSKTFWNNHPVQMRYKTIVNRTTAKLMVDPGKMSESHYHVEEDEKADEFGGPVEDDQIIEIDAVTLDENEEAFKKIKEEPELEQERKQPETNQVKRKPNF